MKDRAHRGPHGLRVVEVGRSRRKRDPGPEGVGSADDGSDVARVLHSVQEQDPVPCSQQFRGGQVKEREDGYRTRRGGERRESLYCVGVGEEVLGWPGGFFYEGRPLGEEEALGLTMFLLFQPGEPFEDGVGVGHCSAGLNLSSSFLGPPTTRTVPSSSGVSGCGRAPPWPLFLIASTIRSFLRWSWRSLSVLPTHSLGASISMSASMSASSSPSSR